MSTRTEHLRLAVVGAGIIGKHHAKAATRHGGFEVVAFVDPDLAEAEAAADLLVSLGAPRAVVVPSIAAAQAATEFDVIAICTPSGLHVRLAEEALATGAHVLIEKPLDTTIPRAKRIAELAATATARGQVVGVVSQKRLDPAAQVIAEAVRADRLGVVTSAIASVAWYRSQEYYDSAGWRGTWELDGGGAVMNQGIHTLDLLIWLLGTPVEITASTALAGHERIEVEDVAVATLRFASGVLALVHCTTAAYPGLSARLSIFGTRGSAILDEDRLAYFHSAAGSGTLASASTTSGTATVDGAEDQKSALLAPEFLLGGPGEAEHFLMGHVRQYVDLHEAITEGRPVAVSVDEALLSLATVRALYAAATTGRPVLIADVLAGVFDGVVPSVQEGNR